jgi:hypothetical protein
MMVMKGRVGDVKQNQDRKDLKIEIGLDNESKIGCLLYNEDIDQT